jgi:hypothetical protein
MIPVNLAANLHAWRRVIRVAAARRPIDAYL